MDFVSSTAFWLVCVFLKSLLLLKTPPLDYFSLPNTSNRFNFYNTHRPKGKDGTASTLGNLRRKPMGTWRGNKSHSNSWRGLSLTTLSIGTNSVKLINFVEKSIRNGKEDKQEESCFVISGNDKDHSRTIHVPRYRQML